MARRPLPPDPWPTVLEGIILDVVGRFTQVEERLIRQVALELRIDGDPVTEARLESITRLREASQAAVADLRGDTGDLADDVIGRALLTGQSFAEAWTRAMLGDLPGLNLPHGALSTALLVQDLHNRFEDVTQRILRWPVDTYQQVISRTAPGVLLGMDSTRTAQAKAWQSLRRLGVTGFTDKANRRWNLATYVEMATRTATRRAFTDSSLATYESYGIDLVTAVAAGGLCDACGRWVGEVMSQHGSGAQVLEVPHATRDTTVRVRVKGSVNDAIADGFQHPNCRCTLVAYFPGLSHDPGPQWSHEDEHAQSDLRALEVEVRRAKRDLAGALDPDDAKAARARVRDMQARIREHIKETGEPRRREREQLNYGHHPGAR